MSRRASPRPGCAGSSSRIARRVIGAHLAFFPRRLQSLVPERHHPLTRVTRRITKRGRSGDAMYYDDGEEAVDLYSGSKE